MKSSTLPYWLTFAVVLAGLYGGFKLYQVQQFRESHGAVIRPKLPPLANFELTDQRGRPFRSEEMKGRVWVVSFFYSTCPFSCARLNENIKYLAALDDLKDVTWVSITVDPDADTQAVLAAKSKEMGADPEHWRFCRHEDFNYIKRLADDVLHIGGVSYKGHNDYVVVIDKRGEVAGMFNGYNLQDLEKGVDLLKQCLAEKASGADHSASST